MDKENQMEKEEINKNNFYSLESQTTNQEWKKIQNQQQQQQQQQQKEIDPYFGLRIEPRNNGGDFDGDLYPSLGNSGFGNPFTNPGGGMLMGPGHPSFHNGISSGFIPPGVPPGARFDPYGPFVPPNSNKNSNSKNKPLPKGGDDRTGDPDPDDFPPPGYIS